MTPNPSAAASSPLRGSQPSDGEARSMASPRVLIEAVQVALLGLQTLNACARCWGSGQTMTELGEDACPDCNGIGCTNQAMRKAVHTALFDLHKLLKGSAQ